MEEYTTTLLKVLLNEHYYSILMSDNRTRSEASQDFKKSMLMTEKFFDKVIEENDLTVDDGHFPLIEKANAALVYLKPKVKMDIIKNRGKISILIAKRNFNLFSKLMFEHLFNLESLTTLEACKDEGLSSDSEVVQAAMMWRMRGLDEQVANVSAELVIAKSLIDEIDDPMINKMAEQIKLAMESKLKEA